MTGNTNGESSTYARSKVQGPSVGLTVVSAICIAILLPALAFDAWLLLSGAAGELRKPQGLANETKVTVRAVWGLLVLAANLVIITGALRMRVARNLGLARAACLLSVIPCFGPCFVLGIPFGVWGLVVLNDPRVRDGFDR